MSFSEHDLNYTAGGRGEQSLFLPLTRGIVWELPLALPRANLKGECRGSLDQGRLGRSRPMAAVLGRWRASYTPGDWLVLSGPTSLVLLEPPTHERAALSNTLW